MSYWCVHENYSRCALIMLLFAQQRYIFFYTSKKNRYFFYIFALIFHKTCIYADIYALPTYGGNNGQYQHNQEVEAA